jgi:hypothetical protein
VDTHESQNAKKRTYNLACCRCCASAVLVLDQSEPDVIGQHGSTFNNNQEETRNEQVALKHHDGDFADCGYVDGCLK